MPNLLQKLGLKPPAALVGAPDMAAANARGSGADLGGAPTSQPQRGDGDGMPPTPAKSGEGGAASAGIKGAPSAGGASGPSGARPGSSPEMVLYAKERLAITRLRTELGKHKQATHVLDKTVLADNHLAAAATQATAADWTKAMAELASARTACEDGKRFADAFADVLVKRAETSAVLWTAVNSGWTLDGWMSATFAGADAKAAPGVRDYAGAKTDFDTIINSQTPRFKKFYIDDVAVKVTALKALKGAPFIAAETAAIDVLMAQQNTSLTAKAWRQMALNYALVTGRIAMAEKIANRRTDFDAERPKADVEVAKVQAIGKPAAAPLAAIQQRLKDVDAMASKANMQFEEAKAALPEILAACAKVGTVFATAAPYTLERGKLAGDLAQLRTHAAAEKVKAELDVVRGVLDQAAQAAGDKGAPGTPLMLAADPGVHDIAGAMVLLGQARGNLTTARGLADSLGGLAGVEKIVSGKPNATDLRKGVDALGAELASARKAAHADLAKAPFDLAQGGIDQAKKLIDAKDTTGATKALATATRQVADGRRIQVEHAEFVSRHAVLKHRLDQYNADKAMAAKVQAKLDELTQALKAADAAETSGDHGQAMSELNKGETAAGAVDAATVRRTAFDKDADQAQLDLDKPAYASIKVAKNQEIGRARVLASAMKFDEAEKIVKSVANAIDAAEADGMARKAPPDPKLAAQVKKLADAGAYAELDDLIKNLPTTVDKQVFIDLAHARFKMTIEAAEDDGHVQESIQRMCALMKDIPKDIVDNPSLKKIKRRVTREDGGTNKDGTNTQQFPFYAANKDEVVMNSRPGQYKKPDFEPGAAGRLPEREESCKPAPPKPGKVDGREDLFDFNMLHELAHAIDDARNYMGTKGKEPDMGGWIELGGNVEQIVDAVVKETGFGKSADERKYVTDRVLRNPAAPLTTFSGDKTKFENFCNAAQTDNVWDSQALTDQATLGKRVYHEGYPNTWFSYLADARKRGITSYQFRAPGEWFSELYAAWKIGKLKAGHPAETWLKKLNVKPKK